MTLRTIIKKTQFEKDIKKVKKQSKNIHKLKQVIELLQKRAILDRKFKDHSLTGDWKGYKECHIEPDWLLIYQIDQDDDLILVRTGSHSELF